MQQKTTVYIDGTNLHKGALELGINLDYKKLYGWLRQKYNAETIYIFLGFVKQNHLLYKKLRGFGYTIVFKDTIIFGKDEIKGNCDTELTVQVMTDLYENDINRFVLITGDGDFACLINVLTNKKKPVTILAPNKKKCSILIRKTKARITNLNDHYHKLRT